MENPGPWALAGGMVGFGRRRSSLQVFKRLRHSLYTPGPRREDSILQQRRAFQIGVEDASVGTQNAGRGIGWISRIQGFIDRLSCGQRAPHLLVGGQFVSRASLPSWRGAAPIKRGNAPSWIAAPCSAHRSERIYLDRVVKVRHIRLVEAKCPVSPMPRQAISRGCSVKSRA
jgi:hypothetical protein